MISNRLGILPFASLAIAWSCLTGCAHYEFDLVDPPEFARHVGDANAQRLTRDPLDYRMQSSEGHLVIKVFNPTNDTILLLGRLSSVVDPGGQSHPLLDQTIAPASFVKLILPPLRPQVTPTGPSIGIGVGVVGYRDAPGPYDDHPRYFAVYDASDPLYWDWQGETDVKLTLVYRRGNDQFTQTFTFHRTKM